jgi:Kef-type K+ transport system membrane component KefB
LQHTESIVYIIFVIFAGTAVLSTVALFTRQSLLVAYMAVGAIFGPWGLKLVAKSGMIQQTGEVGIIFLLFLLGLHLQPKNLLDSLKRMSWISLFSSLGFFGIGAAVGCWFGYGYTESAVIGAAMMFSSTIIGLKLLPTTVLHHQHTGELMISVLLLQDLIAIAVLLTLQAAADSSVSILQISMVVLAIPLLLIVAYVFQRFILIKLLSKFDRIQEYIFLLSIGWCLSMAELAHLMGLSQEIGAFIAGVSIATNPIALFIAESLKPLRDFFLVLIFFSIGAGFNFHYLPLVIVPASVLAVLMLTGKPILFRILFGWFGEAKKTSWELGFRLGQISEFSLLIIYLADSTNLVGKTASYVVQTATILTFIASSYWVVMRYPTPVASSDRLRRD